MRECNPRRLPTMTSQYLPILAITRGNIIESTHYGAFAIVDSTGKVIASHGDSNLVTYPRSSAKPFQAIPFVEIQGHQKWGFSLREIAIMCASHAGTDEHFAVLNTLQAKINLEQDDLLCGVHAPIDAKTRQAMAERGEDPTPNRHNCSGKHTGMIHSLRAANRDVHFFQHINHLCQIFFCFFNYFLLIRT